MFLASSCSCLCPIQWSQVLSREWRCSWSSADRRCFNYIWVIDNFIAYWGATYIRDLTVNQQINTHNHLPRQLSIIWIYFVEDMQFIHIDIWDFLVFFLILGILPMAKYYRLSIIVVQYNMILHPVQQLKKKHRSQILNTRETPISHCNGWAMGVCHESFGGKWTWDIWSSLYLKSFCKIWPWLISFSYFHVICAILGNFGCSHCDVCFMAWTHWDQSKMVAILQTAFSNAFSWMKMS